MDRSPTRTAAVAVPLKLLKLEGIVKEQCCRVSYLLC